MYIGALIDIHIYMYIYIYTYVCLYMISRQQLYSQPLYARTEATKKDAKAALRVDFYSGRARQGPYFKLPCWFGSFQKSGGPNIHSK